jgi:crotonobetainyl-CoA:carnitine CoA-transferase CaiB-like acyl-CoA transferase
VPPPLQGYTVLTVEHAVAAPLATRQLADLGARVIKIERPDTGDFARSYDTAVRGMGSHFIWLNRGKESAALDLKSPRGREALHRLTLESRWWQVPTPVGPVRGLRPLGSDDWSAEPGAVPALGEHTDAVLAELGLWTSREW